MSPEAAPLVDGLLLEGAQTFLKVRILILMRIVKSRASRNHQIIQGATVLQAHVGHDTTVVILAFDSGRKQTDFLPLGQRVQFLPGLAGVILGFVVTAHFRRVNARQTHYASIRELEGIAVKATGHHAFGLGQGVLLSPQRNGQQQAAQYCKKSCSQPQNAVRYCHQHFTIVLYTSFSTLWRREYDVKTSALTAG